MIHYLNRRKWFEKNKNPSTCRSHQTTGHGDAWNDPIISMKIWLTNKTSNIKFHSSFNSMQVSDKSPLLNHHFTTTQINPGTECSS